MSSQYSSIYPNGLTKNPKFFSDVYAYFIRGGYPVILVENILDILTTLSTLIFITFVAFCLDWVGIAQCQSEDTCESLVDYVVYPKSFHANACMIIFIIMFAIYWVSIVHKLTTELYDFFKTRNYFKSIGIKTSEIRVLKWPDVVNRMIAYDNTLSPEIIVNSIMKTDNYVIAMIGSNLFKINPIYYTQSFLWLINVTMMNPILRTADETGKIIIDIKYMTTVMRILAIAQCIFFPFTFTLIIVNYIITFTTDFYTKKSYFGPKEWTLYATMKFREYNELPHIFNERLEKSHKYAKRYEQKFSAHMTNIIMKKAIFFFSTCLTLLIGLTFYDERLVMYIKFLDRPLLWYVAVFTTSIVIARSMIVNPVYVDEPDAIEESAEEIMKLMETHTHFFPDRWKGFAHTNAVLNEFKALYKYKLISVFLEIISAFVIPYYMLTDVSSDLQLVSDFIEKNTKHVEGVGYMCIAGLSENLRMYSSVDDTHSSIYQLLIDDPKIVRSLDNFNMYYHGSTNIKTYIDEEEGKNMTNTLNSFEKEFMNTSNISNISNTSSISSGVFEMEKN